ncbi:MAG: hypothetical protein EBR62_08305 [Verrucomicrobia bacterium]|jgi:hypothetical protein|nr:hypothetical protein [Verrucomicrobiota bacterium]
MTTYTTYEDFEAAYRAAFMAACRYTPAQAGFGYYVDKMAALADAYPDWAEQAELAWEAAAGVGEVYGTLRRLAQEAQTNIEPQM